MAIAALHRHAHRILLPNTVQRLALTFEILDSRSSGSSMKIADGDTHVGNAQNHL